MLGKVAEKLKGVVLGGGVKVWFPECILAVP